MATTLTPDSLRAEINRAGYYPEIVFEAVQTAVAGEGLDAFVVHQETTFDAEEVRRHVTVLVLTPTRLVVGHTDDHVEPGATTPIATTSTESVPIARIASVVVTRVVPDPAARRPVTSEVTVSVGWGAVSRLDLEPAGCADPDCQADHGYTGTTTADDLSLRISAAAEGDDAVRRALDFAAALSLATARVAR